MATLSTQALAGQPATLAFLLQRCYRHPSAPDGTPLPLPTNAEGAGALQMAAASGDGRCVAALLAHEASYVLTFCEAGPGATDASEGAGGGRAAGAAGAAGVRHADHTGFTPLHAAAYRGHATVCEALLAAGADADAECHTHTHAEANGGAAQQGKRRRGSGATPASLAESAGHHALASRLREATSDCEPNGP